jgi:flagellar biosynthesis/type III secretory pathway protein FliH
MTWWSNDAGPTVCPEPTKGRGASMSWDWQDLGSRVPRAGFEDGGLAEDPAVDREKELEEAYSRGFREGEAAGLERALRELDPSRQAAERAASQLNILREELTGQTQENVMALALAVARQVMQREVQTTPGAVAELVEKALTHFPLDQKIRIRLHPADLVFISGEGTDAPPVEAGPREVRWIPDDSVSRGGCLVEGPEHVVDGRLDTALERIYRTVFHD